jgi:anthranilate phosphoribosyltransferase
MEMRSCLASLAEGAVLMEAEAEDVFGYLISGSANPVEIAAFLTALRMRGETVGEIVGAAVALRSHAVNLDAGDDLVDCCGTGGDGASTLNISTTAALIAAACGVRVAKHGNRAVSSRSGSSDVLEALGVNIQATPQQVKRCIDGIGVGFLFAPTYHSAMRHVAQTRAELGFRTIFNLLGPLSNPAGARRQMIGVYSADVMERMGYAALQLGVERALIVHGRDGLDELTITGPSDALLYEGAEPETLVVHPDRLGLQLAPASAIAGGDAQTNASITRAVLDGEKGAPRDVCALNAGAIIWLDGKARTLEEGVGMAQDALDSGAARTILQRLVEISHA